MKKIVTLTCAAVCAVVAASCSESSGPSGSSVLLDASSAFTTVPSGFSDLNSSFAATETDGPFQPLFDGRGPGGPSGRWSFGRGPGFGIGFMGGLGGPFLGFGLLDFFHDGSCAFSSSTGLVTCGKLTRGGLTITHTFKYTDVGGNPQSKIDSTTNTIASTVSVVGTVTHRDSVKSDINESSSQAISGLAKGSTQRKIDGASAGSENTSGTSSMGAFTAQRSAGDTITGVVIPVGTAALSHPPYPSAGTIIRSMTVTVTLSGQSPATSSRREVITYDGSTTAKVVITEDGTTQNCTLPLPFGRLSCQ
jgi:hypothetical protein